MQLSGKRQYALGNGKIIMKINILLDNFQKVMKALGTKKGKSIMLELDQDQRIILKGEGMSSHWTN